MSGLQMNSITGAGQAAAATVASSLARPKATLQSTAKDAQAANGAGSGTTTAGSAAGAATITSSDFLTLLVSELKNQDPTQPTDPNAYIQQLVGVNSLQQLISINQDLTPVTTPAPAKGA
ncbi:MAG: flagellar hook capping FlgD N-terminal domain-containing protein [Edaphobacter sp.]